MVADAVGQALFRGDLTAREAHVLDIDHDRLERRIPAQQGHREYARSAAEVQHAVDPSHVHHFVEQPAGGPGQRLVHLEEHPRELPRSGRVAPHPVDVARARGQALRRPDRAGLPDVGREIRDAGDALPFVLDQVSPALRSAGSQDGVPRDGGWHVPVRAAVQSPEVLQQLQPGAAAFAGNPHHPDDLLGPAGLLLKKPQEACFDRRAQGGGGAVKPCTCGDC